MSRREQRGGAPAKLGILASRVGADLKARLRPANGDAACSFLDDPERLQCLQIVGPVLADLAPDLEEHLAPGHALKLLARGAADQLERRTVLADDDFLLALALD